jgi:hypothetical protein
MGWLAVHRVTASVLTLYQALMKLFDLCGPQIGMCVTNLTISRLVGKLWALDVNIQHSV